MDNYETLKEKYDSAIDWIINHCYDESDVAITLNHIGLNHKEILNAVLECTNDKDTIEEAMLDIDVIYHHDSGLLKSKQDYDNITSVLKAMDIEPTDETVMRYVSIVDK